VKVEFLDREKVLRSLRRAARQLRRSHSLVQQVVLFVEVFPDTCDEMARGQADSTSFIHSVMAGTTEVLA